MKAGLVGTLLSRGLIGFDTVVTARIGAKTRIGTMRYAVADYTITKSEQNPESWDLLLRSVIGQLEVRASDGDIVALDGMSVDRYADVYNINSDGTDKKVGRKRGRKPKVAAQ